MISRRNRNFLILSLSKDLKLISVYLLGGWVNY